MIRERAVRAVVVVFIAMAVEQAEAAAPNLTKLKDGPWHAHAAWVSQYRYETVVFQKRGTTATGYMSETGGVHCFQGTIQGNIITVQRATTWEDDYENGRPNGKYHFIPPSETDLRDLQQFRIEEPPAAFPMPLLWITADRDKRWLNGCVKHFAESSAEEKPPAPCGDEQLRATMPSEGQWPTYVTGVPTPICNAKSDARCTRDSVFAILISNPAAIGPTKDDTPRKVKNCEIVLLESFMNTVFLPKKYEKDRFDNPIRVEIDHKQHRVTNYTLPGHVFWPGQVIRQIEERDNGEIVIKTAGYGNEDLLVKYGLNFTSAIAVWVHSDLVLYDAYHKRYPRRD